MNIKASADRMINEEQHQVLVLVGQVDSHNAQPVLAEGCEYRVIDAQAKLKGGSLLFELQVEAVPPAKDGENEKPVKVEVEPILASSLTREEQAEVFARQQLADPNLDADSKLHIRERFGWTDETV